MSEEIPVFDGNIAELVFSELNGLAYDELNGLPASQRGGHDLGTYSRIEGLRPDADESYVAGYRRERDDVDGRELVRDFEVRVRQFRGAPGSLRVDVEYSLPAEIGKGRGGRIMNAAVKGAKGDLQREEDGDYSFELRSKKVAKREGMVRGSYAATLNVKELPSHGNPDLVLTHAISDFADRVYRHVANELQKRRSSYFRMG